jgi:hypothetical protein
MADFINYLQTERFCLQVFNLKERHFLVLLDRQLELVYALAVHNNH